MLYERMVHSTDWIKNAQATGANSCLGQRIGPACPPVRGKCLAIDPDMYDYTNLKTDMETQVFAEFFVSLFDWVI